MKRKYQPRKRKISNRDLAELKGMVSLVDSEGKSQNDSTVVGPREQPGQREQDGGSLLWVILPKPRTDR